jgi:outer membrane receptor protein involved in Fe transport
MIMLVVAHSAYAEPAQPAEPIDEATVRATTSAQPSESSARDAAIAIDQLTLADDLIGAAGLRPIGARRGEVLVSTGNDATHQAAGRASDTVGGAGVELTGALRKSDVLGDRTAAGARIEHATESDRARAYATYGTSHVGLARQSFLTDERVATYGAAWTAWRSAGTLELQAFGEQAALSDTRAAGTFDLEGSLAGAHVGFTSRRVQAFGLDHQFSGDIDVMQATGAATSDVDDGDMLTHMTQLPRTKRGRHRFLSAYLHDTIRVIESLDVHGGFVFEHWSWLTNLPPLGALDAVESNMNLDGSDLASALLVGPTVGAIYRVAPSVALEANAYRRLRTPSWQQLMRPVQNGGVRTLPGDLGAETVTGGRIGPSVSRGTIEAHAVAYWNEVDAPISPVTIGDDLRMTTNLGHARETGVEAAASWRVAKPVVAGVGYTFAQTRVTDGGDYASLTGKELAQSPRHRATALLAYDEPKLVTLTGAVRYVASRYEDDQNTTVAKPFTVVDAMAARKLTHGLAGFVSVENVFDRRYVAQVAGVDTVGAPRLVQVGLRLDSARW